MHSEIQNPHNQAPEEILRELVTLQVEHFGFDGEKHAGEIIVHNKIAVDIADFFEYALELNFPINSVIPIHDNQFVWDDEKSCEANNSSGFNYRTVAVGLAVSKHSIGCAFDINPKQNPYIRFEDGKEVFTIPSNSPYDITAPGTLSASHPLVILMKTKGWTWGGDWKPESGRVDYQHFEKVPPGLFHYIK